MSEEWYEPPSTGFAKWEEPGDELVGVLTDYDLAAGATDFNGNECGYVVIVTDDDEAVNVTLDKGSLRDAVKGVIQRIDRGGYENPVVKILFDSLKDNKAGTRQYKFFRCMVKEGAKGSKAKAAKTAGKKTSPDAAPF